MDERTTKDTDIREEVDANPEDDWRTHLGFLDLETGAKFADAVADEHDRFDADPTTDTDFETTDRPDQTRGF